MSELNIAENALHIAYMMKRVSAHFHINYRGDQMAQVISKFLDNEAKKIEAETLESLKRA